jgi:hypothetical protein
VEGGIELLRRLGALHDARIEEIVWRKADRSLRLTISDMFSSAHGLPEYHGPTPGVVTFVAVENLAVETGLFRGVLGVSAIDAEERGDGVEVRIGLTEPGADLRLRCREVKVTIAAR